MILSVLYAIVRLLLRLLLNKRSRERELEILVLRHQLQVLQRNAGRPLWRRSDRFILATLPWQTSDHGGDPRAGVPYGG
jgi:hypothetical protein